MLFIDQIFWNLMLVQDTDVEKHLYSEIKTGIEKVRDGVKSILL